MEMIRINTAKENKHRPYLLILLWLVPFLATNFGVIFIKYIENHWQMTEQQEIARQELESLSAGARFDYQFARTSGDFRDALSAAAEGGMSQEAMASYLEQRSEVIFREPFPEHHLFVFSKAGDDAQGNMLTAKSKGLVHRRILSRIFAYMVDLSREKKIPDTYARQSETMLKQILGSQSDSEIMARSQRGKASFAFYNKFSSWFLWDYIETESGEIFGFMILTPNNDSCKTAAMLLALRDLRDRQTGLGAFIPLFKDFSNSVLLEPLNKSASFRQWINEHKFTGETDIGTLLKRGPPPPARIEEYIIYSHLGRESTHLSVLALPIDKLPMIPGPLKVFNQIFIALMLMIVIRGLLLDSWPVFSLRIQFAIIYLLAAALPVSILIIAAFGYIAQYQQAVLFQTQSTLELAIKRFDSSKARILESYRSAFDAAIKDKQLQDILASEDLDKQQAIDRAKSFFDNRFPALPILGMAIFDIDGNSLRGYSDLQPEHTDTFINAFRYPLVELLRQKYAEQHPDELMPEFKVPEIEKLTADAYHSVTGNVMSKEFDNRRSQIIERMLGAKSVGQLHEIININGKSRYMMLISWDAKALDGYIIRQTIDYFAINNPEFNFVTYRVEPQGLSYVQKPLRHVESAFLYNAQNLAQHASFRQSLVSATVDGHSMVAIPAKAYDTTVIVGGISTDKLKYDVTLRLIFLTFILILSIILVLIFSYIAAKLLVVPITSMKDATDHIASGNLKLEIISEAKDEIGELSQEFAQMTIGLRERESLSTLLSDQAIEALEKHSSEKLDLIGESFEGVALVSDIRNFTGICETRSPDHVVNLLNQHFSAMAQIINTNGGQIYKFIGDAIEAVFHESQDEDNEPAALRAFKAASQMNLELIKINKKRRRQKLFEYGAGIGLAYGKLFSGSIGSSDTRMDFAVLGDPLKKAAKLEAASVQSPAFPLVTDSTIAQALKDKGITFSQLEGVEDAWILSELGHVSLESTKSIPEAQEPEATGLSSLPRFVIGKQFISRNRAFLMGLALLIAIFAAAIWADDFRFKNLAENEKLEIISENLRLMEQMGTERSYQVAFESLMGNMASHIQTNLPWQRGSDEPKLMKKLLLEKLNEASSLKDKPLNIALFSFDQDYAQQGSVNNFSHKAMTMGWNEEELSIMEALAVYKHHYHLNLPEEEIFDQWWPAIKDLVGDNNTPSLLYNDGYGSATPIQKGGEHYLFYWRQIYVLEPGTIDSAFSKDDAAFNDINNFNYRIAGTILATIPVAHVADSLKILVEGYSDNDNKIALVSKTNEIIAEHSFPAKIKADLSFDSKPYSTAEQALAVDEISIHDQEWKAVVVRRITEHSSTLKYAMFFTLFLALSWFWWHVTNGNSFINRSLTGKLWLSLLASATLPLVTVAMVFSLFANEHYYTQMAQERKNLQRFVESFELKEDYSTPLAWQIANRTSYSPDFLEAVKKYSSNPDEQNLVAVDRLVEKHYQKVTQNPAIDGHFHISQVVLITSNGTQYSYNNPAIRSNESGSEGEFSFTTLLKQNAQFLMRTVKPEYASQQSDAEALRNEIVLDTALEIVKLMFGDEAYIKMSNAIGIPVMVTVQYGSAGLLVHSVPSFSSPEMIIIWMIMFKNNHAIKHIATNHHGNYRMFIVEEHACGRFAGHNYAFDDSNLVTAASQIAHSNLPISRKIQFGSRNFLLEAFPTVNFRSIIMAGLAPEAPILREQNSLWGNFLIVVFIIILLIILLASAVSAEILQPIGQLKIGMREISEKNYSFRIAHSRLDELGELCNAFDHMAKRLEEKQLMSSMLSKDAQNSSMSSSQQNKAIDVTLLYIGIPSFDDLMSLTGPESIFADLRQQVTLIARIIIESCGDIDKVIGDKILAVFRNNGNAEQATIEACRTAQLITRAESSGKIPFPVAIGINRGTVITGFLGAGQKRDYTIIGDAVNLAARIEALAEQVRFNRCLVSETVYASAENDFSLCEFGEVELKGKQRPVKVYQMIS